MKSLPNFLCLLLSLVLAPGSWAATKESASGKTVGTGTSFKGPIGLQLYSLRGDFTKNVPATLEKVREMGFKNVELAGTYNLSTPLFNEMLKSNGLQAVSAHFPFDRYRTNPEAIAIEAKALGVQYAGCAWITHEGTFDEKECRTAIEVFNRAGEILATKGIKFFYHIHGYEFQPHGNGTLFDLMMAETKPQFVRYEMDVYWAVHPGQDPVKLLQKHGRRWELMHLKDMKKGVEKGILTGKSDVNNNVVLGTGEMDWPAILKAAERAGVRYYFIEDEAATAAEQIPQSLRYLEQVKW